MARNQCDGCRAGMPVTNGVHYRDGRPHIACTASRYEDVLDEMKFIVSTVALFPCACGEQESELCTSCRARAVMRKCQKE